MAAPDLPTLFDFETNYEQALAAYLAAISGTPFAQVITPRTLMTSEPILTTPRVFVKMATAQAGTQLADIPNTNSQFYPHHYGTMSVDVISQRNATTQDHGQLRGWARYAMQDVAATFNSNSLPYYQTLFVSESGAHQGINPENDEIVTSLTFAMEFAIIPSQWPA